MNKQDIFFIFIICIFLVLNSYLVYKVVTNINSINKDPIIYAVASKGYSSCECYDTNNRKWYANSTSLYTILEPTTGLINYSELKDFNLSNFIKT